MSVLRLWEPLRQVAVAALTGRKPSSPRFLLQIAVAFCAVVGVYDVLTITLFLSGGPFIGPQRWVLFPDFVVFHAASHAFLQGKLAVVYNLGTFSDYLNQNYFDHFKQLVDFRPFLYPPPWLLLTIPLALLGSVASYAIFMATTGALATVLIGRTHFWIWMATLTSPAGLWTMISGQNCFLSVGLFYGGMRLLDRSPVVAGILLGLLSYKPQLWILIPVALLAARRWLPLAWAIGTATCLALASLLVFGLEFWIQFFEMARASSTPKFTNQMFTSVSSFITTVLVACRILGVPIHFAHLIHVAVAIAAVIVVWRAFSRYPISDESTAILAAGTLLISPYLINYDMLLLMPAALLVFRRRVEGDLYPGELPFYLGLWLIPNVGIRLNSLGLPLMPVFIVGLLFLAWQTLKQQASPARTAAPASPATGSQT